MKNRYPENYATLTAYKPFRDAYKVVRKEFELLEKMHFETIRKEMDVLNSSHPESCFIKENTFWIKKRDGSQVGTTIFSEDKAKLLPVLNSSRYQDLVEFFQE
jgi:hypothetical protein